MASFGLGRSNNNNANSDIDSSTPWVAASEGNVALLQSSLAALQLPLSVADENGYTLLQAAASYNQMEVLSFLFSNGGVNVDAVDNDGDSVLHHAGNVQTV